MPEATMSQSQKVQARLQAIEERLARLRAERDRLAARASKTARRQETRRKIVIGGTVLAALEHECVPAMRTKVDLLNWLESRLTRPHDRSVLELTARRSA
jgi:hypothetical protein